jgi:hypothetical protein
VRQLQNPPARDAEAVKWGNRCNRSFAGIDSTLGVEVELLEGAHRWTSYHDSAFPPSGTGSRTAASASPVHRG